VRHWRPAYVGLGSNLDDPRTQVERAVQALGSLPQALLIAQSPLYRTAPQGVTEQPQFVNAVAALLTTLSLREFSRQLLELQARLGRGPDVERWGPRRIDLDLLVFGRERCSEPDLVVPHPRLGERAFVLYPLCDVAPQLDVPGMGQAAQLLARLPEQGVRRLS
jgi:2-amino-4-hydroxy-6-hydroxymethyldihydropteridine diphosphokinase